MDKENRYVSVRLFVAKTGRYKRQIEHDFRVKNVSYAKEDKPIIYIGDGKIKKLNKTEVEAEEIAKRIWEKHKEEVNEINKNRRKQHRIEKTAITGVLTFSPSITKELQKIKDKKKRLALFTKYAKQAVSNIAKEIGSKDIEYIVLHIDETTPHFHFALKAYSNDNKALARHLYNNKKLFERLQDIAAEPFKTLGFTRGRSKRETNARHLSVYEMHHEAQQLELIKRFFNLTGEEIKQMQKNKKYIAEILVQSAGLSEGHLRITERFLTYIFRYLKNPNEKNLQRLKNTANKLPQALKQLQKLKLQKLAFKAN